MSSSQKGFTLVEVIITLLVITLVLAVSYPSLSRGTASLSLRTTGRDILNTLRYARQKAVTEQTGMQVTVDRENQLVRMTNDLGEGNRVYILPDPVRIQRVVLGGTETFASTSTVRFLPNGSSDKVEILLESRNGSYLRIVSDPLTGGASILPGTGEEAR
ncbi:MAG: GspH/FimT family pseudopilin [Acidobacteriota bacterium]|jgi:prepilin-type N-terminal cleavage/methylation domain-containing protein